jgi:hypothetical protein
LKVKHANGFFETSLVPVRAVILVDEAGANASSEIVLCHKKAGNIKIGYRSLQAGKCGTSSRLATPHQ